MRRGNLPFLLLFAFFVSACTFKSATLFPPTPSQKQAIRDVYAIVLLFDGARPGDVDRMVEQGRLPNIKRLFYDQGARYQKALAVVPTASTPAHQAFLSGLFPGHHGIPSLDWFSRPLEKYIDYLKPRDILLTNTYLFNFKQVEQNQIASDRPQLLFHDLTGHPTMTVFEPVNSGATMILPEKPPFITAYHGKIEKFYEEFDFRAMRLTLDKFRQLPTDSLPRFSFVACYGMDLVTHFDGLRGNRVQDLLIHYDRFVGELEKTLRERGIWDKTTLIALSDHGQHELSKVTDLKEILNRIGLRFNLGHPKQGQVMFGDHGLSFSNLYFKNGKDWSTPPNYSDLRTYPLKPGKEVDLIARFLEEPDIEFVIARDGPWRLHLHRRGEHATIERRLEGGLPVYAYRPDPGSDPLSYLDRGDIAAWVREGRFQDGETWLKATLDETFPDAVVLLSTLFADYRVGDLILLTVKESQFKEKRFAGHGSMYAEDLHILLMLHGPDILPGLYPYARSVDLYPTLLRLFGLPIRNPMDGVARLEPWGKTPFPDSPAQNAPAQGYAAEDFRARLLEKLSGNSLTEEEREKARQLLYTLDILEKDLRQYAQPGPGAIDHGLARKP